MKDLRLFLTDRLALFMFILFPLLFITMFSLMNSGGATDNRLYLHLTTAEAEPGLSHQIIDSLETEDESVLEPGAPVFVRINEYDEALQLVEDEEIGGFLSFPADFTEGLMEGRPVELEVVADAEQVDTRAVLHGLAQTLAARIGADQVAVNSAVFLLIQGGMADEAEIQEIINRVLSGEGASTSRFYIEFVTEKVGDVEAENAANWALPGYLVMFVFFGAALAAESIVRERESNTLERLLAGSVSRNTILAGMFVGTAARGLVQIVVFWTIGVLVYKIDLGYAPAAVIILSILMVIVSSAFGIMLATMVKTQRSASSVAVLASLVMAPLGGCWWPLFILPRWMQSLAKITPHGWATTGFNKLMLFGSDFSSVVPEMLVLLIFAVVFGIIAAWRFRTNSA